MKTIGIIGAGASGLACVKALLESNQNIHILLFERNDKIAKKIAATGNGHCNLSNTNIDIASYQGDVLEVIDLLKDFDIESFCYDLGFLTRKKGNLYYPYSEQAKTVVHAFEKLISERVDLRLNTQIMKIKQKNNIYQLIDQNKQVYYCDYVVVSAGAKAGKGFGTDGQIYDVLKPLGLDIVPLRPSLVALCLKENVKKLKGCRIHGVFTLKNNNEVVASYPGEALFSDDGISGICCMQLSRFLEFSKDAHYTIHCNLRSELSDKQLQSFYDTYGANYHGLVLDKIADYLSYKETTNFMQFKERLENLVFNINSTRSFEFAQVTKGGIPLRNLNKNFEVKHLPNFYLCGEVLNIDGDCGGFNLHFAFASGLRVGKDISQQIEI